MRSQKGVTPVKTGVQRIYNGLKRLDSGFRRNDVKPHFLTFCEIVKVDDFVQGLYFLPAIWASPNIPRKCAFPNIRLW
jgi:hypothetical protein